MKNQSSQSAIVSILGRNHPDINAMGVRRGMSTVGEVPADRINNRTIRIQRDEMLDQYTPAESFEVVTDKIAQLTSNRREEIENILIATGSSKGVRRMYRRGLNAEIQNRLTEKTKDGERFRAFITAMISHDFGGRLTKDGFFRVHDIERGETFAGAGLENPFSYNPVDYSLQTPTISTGSDYTGSYTDPITPYAKTEDDGIVQTKSEKDWGSIFTGSAQLINSIGGFVGLFTGGNKGNENNNIFNDKSEADILAEQQQYERDRRARNTKVILGVLGAIALIVIVIVIVKQSKKNKASK